MKEVIFEAEVIEVSNEIFTNSENAQFIKVKVNLLNQKKPFIRDVYIWKQLHDSNEYENGDIISVNFILKGKLRGFCHIHLEGLSKFTIQLSNNFDFYKQKSKKKTISDRTRITYSQYGGPLDGYGGSLDDDFINDVLDGKPDAYWNID